VGKDVVVRDDDDSAGEVARSPSSDDGGEKRGLFNIMILMDVKMKETRMLNEKKRRKNGKMIR